MGKQFGGYLKRVRADRKLTLRQVEDQTGVSNAYLSQVESGTRSTPTMKILVKLAEAYGVSISALNKKAASELYQQGMSAGRKNKNMPKTLLSEAGLEKLPPPDSAFIQKSYDKLPEKKKIELKKYLQYLLSEEKK